MIRMMSLFALVMTMLVASSGLTNRVSAYQQKERKELEEIYAKLDKALKSKDVDTLVGYEAPNFQLKQKDGKAVSKAEFDGIQKQLFGSAKEVTSVETKIDKFEEDDDDFIVTTTQSVKMVLIGQDGKDHQLTAVGQTKDTWSFAPKTGWKLLYSEEISSSVDVDGQKVQ